MKKTFAIASAVLITAAFVVSCQTQEFNNEAYVPQEGEILFRIGNNSKATKSSDASIMNGLSIDLGTVNGISFHMEESVSRVDNTVSGPSTKGTPAYTENFNALYGSFSGAVYRTGETTVFDDGAYDLADAATNLYKRKLANTLWEKEGLYFFSRTPVGIIDDTTIVKELTYYPVASGDYSAGDISFSYDGTSLKKAEDQKDILFTSRPVSNDTEYKQLTTTGLPILFHHALTGVKFAIDNYGGDNNIAIDSVIFNGLFDSGDCVISPDSEDEYSDDISYHSSATAVKWGGLEVSSTAYTAAFSDTVYFAPGGNFGSADNKYPASFSNAGNKHNLNDAAATKTFWFIPQSIARGTGETPVTLTIVYSFDGKQDRWTLNLSEIVKNTVWLAGDIRTYTIRIDDVNVKIEDKVSMAAESEQPVVTPWGTKKAKSYAGSVKDSVVITNTGNTDAFIRAAIVGQWLDQEGNPVFGFTDFTHGVQLVASWYEDQFGDDPQYDQGSFEGLVGYKGETSTTWEKGTDGFYYFKDPVAPGDTTATRLFKKYTVGAAPAAAVAGNVQDIYFQLEIAVQAISAKKIDGSSWTDYSSAWANAKAQE